MLVLLLIFIVFTFKHVKKKFYRNLIIVSLLTLILSYVFINSQIFLIENFFVIYDNHLNIYENNRITGTYVYERFILDLVGRLDITHIINSWWNQVWYLTSLINKNGVEI